MKVRQKLIRPLVSLMVVVLWLMLIATPALAISPPDSLQIDSVFAYQHCLETDDQLYLVEYTIYYEPVGEVSTNPDENVTEAYLGRFMDGATELKAVAPYAYYDEGYGQGIFAIYFSASDPNLPVWEGAYTIKLEGNPTLSWDPSIPSTSVSTFDLWSSSTSITTTQGELTARVLYLADQLELAWGINMLDTTGTGSYLSDYGGAYFTNAIPSIQVMAPNAFAGGTTQPQWPSIRGTLHEYYMTGGDGDESIFGDIWQAQTFTPSTSHRVTKLILRLYREGGFGLISPTAIFSIKAVDGLGHPTGDDLCSGTIEGNSMTIDSSGAWYEVTLGEGYNLVVDTKYAIVGRAPDGTAITNIQWISDSTLPTYSGGNVEYSADAGATWGSDINKDFMFGELWYHMAEWSYAEERADSIKGTMLDVTPVAEQFGVSRMWMSTLLFMLGAAFMLYAMLKPTGSFRGLVFLSVPLFIAGGYLGGIPLQLTVLVGFAGFVLSIWMMFYHPSGA